MGVSSAVSQKSLTFLLEFVCFILNFSCDFLNLFVFSFFFFFKFFLFLSFASVFSHNFRFSIFAGVAVSGEFLKQCEIS